jgi:hypothetical protein
MDPTDQKVSSTSTDRERPLDSVWTVGEDVYERHEPDFIAATFDDAVALVKGKPHSRDEWTLVDDGEDFWRLYNGPEQDFKYTMWHIRRFDVVRAPPG